jgi:rubrerythrin
MMLFNSRRGAPMDEKKFHEMLQFAIDREIESVRFYTEGSQKVKHSGTKELFLDFAGQEKKHKQKLQDVRKGKRSVAHIQHIPDLKISDYLVDSELTPESSYADTLRIAMKREERSVKLYTDLKEKNTDKTLVNLFTFLVQEESKHKYVLEKLYDDEVLK